MLLDAIETLADISREDLVMVDILVFQPEETASLYLRNRFSTAGEVEKLVVVFLKSEA